MFETLVETLVAHVCGCTWARSALYQYTLRSEEPVAAAPAVLLTVLTALPAVPVAPAASQTTHDLAEGNLLDLELAVSLAGNLADLSLLPTRFLLLLRTSPRGRVASFVLCLLLT